jgi:hypothetical protein
MQMSRTIPRIFFAAALLAGAQTLLIVDNGADRLDESRLREYDNILFDPVTLETYWRKSETVVSATWLTFEAATWRGTFGQLTHLHWPWLHPMGFATADTANQAATIARLYLFGHDVSVEVVENNRITGPFSRTVERQLVVVANTNKDKREEFSAGRFAERYMIRNPFNGVRESTSAEQFRAECRRAGVIR